MSFRIAFDLDGVLADMDAALKREAESLFGETVIRQEPATTVTAPPPPGVEGLPGPPEEAEPDETLPPTRLQLTSRQERRLWRHVAGIENFWESLREIEPGSIRRLSALAAERRWEVIFLTRRPETAGLTAQAQTQRWLVANGFDLPSVFVVRRSRGRVAAALALHFVVDDTPANCLDVVVESSARAVLVWREEENRIPAAAKRLGVGVVKSMGESLKVLAEVDAAMSEQRPGVVGRVLQLLGLKEAPARV